jgi:peptidoglycan/LPS O-acetylase OafA/YrhL
LVHVLLRRAGTALLSSRLWAWVGRVSFGGYVFHVAVMMMASAELDRHFGGMNRAARQLCEFAITWSVTVALASASFTWFEQPIAQRWRQRRLHHRPQHVSAHSTVVVDT